MTFWDIDFAALLTAIGICAQIFFIDLLLSADNAMMIALASRSLPADEMHQAALLGTAGAVGLRVAMAAGVMFLLQVPYLKIVAGGTLLVIAVRLTLEHDDPGSAPAIRTRGGVMGAVATIILADAVMSLDNVVAIAAIAQGSLLLLGFGLALSIPMLIKGSALIRGFFRENGLLVTFAGMFLGWIAGQIGVSDPAVANWVETSAPALVFAVPAACAIFVLWESRILMAAQVRGGRGEVDVG